MSNSNEEGKDDEKASKKQKTSDKDVLEPSSAEIPDNDACSAKMCGAKENLVKEVDNAQVEEFSIKVEESAEKNTPEKQMESTKTKYKMLGPRSKRKRLADNSDSKETEDKNKDHDTRVNAKEANLTVMNEIECALSPSSPTKKIQDQDTMEEHEPDQAELRAEGFSPVPKSTYDFILQKKHVRCNVRLVSLFRSELCKATCHHCADPASYTVHSMDIDIPNQAVYMECQACGWTTIRRISMGLREVLTS